MPRKAGTPKTGGRQKGSRNKATAELRDIIDSEMKPKELVAVLKDVAKDKEAPHAARVGAVRELWDRRYGKAPQAITGADGGPLSIVAALGKASDDELEELIARMAGGLTDVDG